MEFLRGALLAPASSPTIKLSIFAAFDVSRASKAARAAQRTATTLTNRQILFEFFDALAANGRPAAALIERAFAAQAKLDGLEEPTLRTLYPRFYDDLSD